MKILLITPIYATTTQGSGATPVVHYFAKEWVKQGYDVTVFNLVNRFPRLFYVFARLFKHQLNTRLGMLVPTECPSEDDYEAEGVYVHKRLLRKVKPHSRYSRRTIKYAVDLIAKYCEQNGAPDYFIGHWDNPQLEILTALKQIFNKPACLVLHSNDFDFEEFYGDLAIPMLNQIDVIGFRNQPARERYESLYGKVKNSFICYSGVSDMFLNAGLSLPRPHRSSAWKFVYSGSLIGRKHPAAVLTALCKAFPDGDFEIVYVGDGAEKSNVEYIHKHYGNIGKVTFTGRIPREDVVGYLKDADVFVMISEGEIFGLVYLEAMALGLIPIGSRHEGIDGVIVDGVNGFLCEAGNSDELASILGRIRSLPEARIELISEAARKTSLDYSDSMVAKQYIDYVKFHTS